jgi:8-oxo-dGTP diphosphatase
MENSTKYLDYILQIQAIAKIGLKYSKDSYALKNYHEIQTLSKEMLEDFVNLKFERPNYFERDIYPTPNISVRTILFNQNKEVLLVKEKSDHGYSFPGGWCDLYDSPSVAAIRECEEEAGVKIKLTRLVGLTSRIPYLHAYEVPSYVIIFLGEIIENLGKHDHEIEEVGFFPLDNLPSFSPKVTSEEMLRFIHAAVNGETIYD